LCFRNSITELNILIGIPVKRTEWISSSQNAAAYAGMIELNFLDVFHGTNKVRLNVTFVCKKQRNINPQNMAITITLPAFIHVDPFILSEIKIFH